MSEVPVIETPPEEEGQGKRVDNEEADKIAEAEFKNKYPGFGKRPSGMAKRKISSTGGKQYFDSGEYNRQESKTVRNEMRSLPHAMDPKSISHPSAIPPHLARMKAKPKAPTSSLAAAPVTSTKTT